MWRRVCVAIEGLRRVTRSDTRCGTHRGFGRSFVSKMVERSHALVKRGHLHHSTTSTREAIDGAAGTSSAVTSTRRRRRRATSIVACTRVRSSIARRAVETVASSLERESRVSRRGRPRRGIVVVGFSVGVRARAARGRRTVDA